MMGSKLRFHHLNVAHGRASAILLGQVILDQSVDFASINEPYLGNEVPVGVPAGYSVVRALGRSRAVLAVSPRIQYCAIVRTTDVVAVKCETTAGITIVATCYCSPNEVDSLALNLSTIRQALTDFDSDHVILVGDFNAKSTLWGQRPTDARGRELITFATTLGFDIVNNPDSRPSCSSSRGESWVDVLLVRGCLDRITDWDILDDETLSDHNAMVWNYSELLVRRLPSSYTQRWRLKDMNRERFSQDLCALDLPECDQENTDQNIDFLVSNLQTLCRRHTRRRTGRARSAYWWTDGLAIDRKRVRALRRKSQRTLSPERRREAVDNYRRARAEYKRALLRTKRKAFQSFLSDSLVSDKMGQVIGVVRGRFRPDDPAALVLGSGQVISSYAEIQSELAKYHFRLTDDCLVWSEAVDYLDVIIPFTAEELELALEGSPPGKAPGHDGLGKEFVDEVYRHHPRWLLELYNACLRSAHFPKVWKQAIVVFFLKDGKPKSDAASYRPICLLPAMGKVLDKMIATRLVCHLEAKGVIDHRQYGFRRGRSTVDALNRVKSFIEEARDEGLMTCLVSLDIKNAFNSCRRADIMRILRGYQIPLELQGLVASFLTDRSVLEGNGELKYNVGVPQGSCLGPTLWLVLMNELLTQLTDTERWRVQAFADDLIIMAKSEAGIRFIPMLNPVLHKVSDWASGCGLEFSLGKCIYTVISARGKSPRTVSWALSLGNGRVRHQTGITYLGVYFDSDLSWMPHLTRRQEAASKFQYKLSRVASAMWGLKPSVLKAVYLTVTEKMLLYAAPIWYTGHVKQRQRLASMQRPSLLCITKAYSTVSTDALCVLAGVLPLDLRAASEKSLTGLSRFGRSDDRTRLTPDMVEGWRRPLPHKEDLRRIPWTKDLVPKSLYRYYTDGSKQEDGRTGCGYLLESQGEIVREGMLRLSDNATVFAAEVQAIFAALTDAERHGYVEVDVFSDSRSALNALNKLAVDHRQVSEIKDLVKSSGITVHAHWVRAHVGHVFNEKADELAKGATTKSEVDVEVALTVRQVRSQIQTVSLSEWQERWDESDKGRTTHSVFPKVSLKRVQGDFFMNQVLTGHGVFGSHQNRIFGSDPTCISCGVSESSTRHVLCDCPTWRSLREKHFPKDYQARTNGELCLDYYSRKGVLAIVKSFFEQVFPPPGPSGPP